jgi:hypothetical protein
MEKDGKKSESNHPEVEVVSEATAAGRKEKQRGQGYSTVAQRSKLCFILTNC